MDNRGRVIRSRDLRIASNRRQSRILVNEVGYPSWMAWVRSWLPRLG